MFFRDGLNWTGCSTAECSSTQIVAEFYGGVIKVWVRSRGGEAIIWKDGGGGAEAAWNLSRSIIATCQPLTVRFFRLIQFFVHLRACLTIPSFCQMAQQVLSHRAALLHTGQKGGWT